MNAAAIANAVWGATLLAFGGALLFAVYRKRRRGRGFVPGPGAAGAVYDLLNQDKRNAIELIVEDRAAERDEEHTDDTVDDDAAFPDSDTRRSR